MTSEDESHLKISYRSDTLEIDISESTTISELASQLATRIEAEESKISLFIMPKPGLLKYPFPETLLSTIITPKTRIKLVGTPTAEIQKLDSMSIKTQARDQARQKARASAIKPSKSRDWKRIQEESQYTFHAIQPLPYLPDPEKSYRFLQRLAADPGIKAAMRIHKFSVGLFTEMNPAEHTTHESRTLGLNRNRGEVIELRLRTDRYDGYRDYKVIRKTLCHELSHNVWGDHDRNFWDLTKKIEEEVERNDYLHGGKRLNGGEEFYNPDDNSDQYAVADDHGGWTGGEYVLGRSEEGLRSAHEEVGLSRREIIARAAMARQEKQKKIEQEQKEEGGDEQ